MNKGMLIAVVAIVIIGAVGLLAYRSYQAKAPAINDVSPTAAAEMETISTPVVAMLESKTFDLDEQNDSEESGTATLVEENGTVKVILVLNGEPEDAIQPAHIHVGSCPTPGAVKYPLTNVVDGKSETVLNVTMEDLKGFMPLAINIHESAAKINNYVACGNVEL